MVERQLEFLSIHHHNIFMKELVCSCTVAIDNFNVQVLCEQNFLLL